MKKYFAIKASDADLDTELYYSEEDALVDHLIIVGNENYRAVNEELLTLVDTILYEELTAEVVKQKIIDTTGYSVDSEILAKILMIAKQFKAKESQPPYLSESRCNILGLIFGDYFTTGLLFGKSSLEFVEYYAPAGISDNLAYIESVYFKTGAEYYLTAQAYDEIPDMKAVPVTAVWTFRDPASELADNIPQGAQVEII